MHLTIKYAKCDEPSEFDNGEIWCSDLAEIEEIKEDIISSDLWETMKLKDIAMVGLAYEKV